uniref:Titin n=1 Tax=Cacopsylla melanoneura TaxID=428564 RepID=A0A8D8XMJ0_9HEMI
MPTEEVPEISEEKDRKEKPKKKRPTKPEEIPAEDLASVIERLKPLKRDIVITEQKPTKVKIIPISELPFFATLKLKKTTKRPEKDIKSVEVHKFLLKSRILRLDYPPMLHYCTYTDIPEIFIDNGILSRNYEEAKEIKKTKRRKFKPTPVERQELEKFEPAEDLPLHKEKPIPEEVKKPREKPEKAQPEETEPRKLVMGKGKIPQEEDEQEKVTLKKIPSKPKEEEKPAPEKVDKPVLEKPLRSEPEDDESYKLKPVKPLPTGESPELPVPEEKDTSVPKEKKEAPKKKPGRWAKPEKEEEVPEDRKLELGKPKEKPEEPEDDIKLKYKQGPREEEQPEPIKLKPFKKDKPEDETKPKEPSVGKPKPFEYEREEEEIKPKEFEAPDDKKIKKKKKPKAPGVKDEIGELEKPEDKPEGEVKETAELPEVEEKIEEPMPDDIEEKDVSIIEEKKIRKKKKAKVDIKEIEEPVERPEECVEKVKVEEKVTRVKKIKVKKGKVEKIDFDMTDVLAPRFIEKIQPVVSHQEQPALFTCKVEGHPKPTTSWQKDGIELHASEHYVITTFENVSTLEIINPTKEDIGVFSCKATNIGGVATCSANLIVLEKEESGEAPKFIKPLKPVIADAQAPATLRATVTGRPTPSVAWYRAQEEIIPDNEHTIVFIPETGECVLSITEATPLDEAVYSVKAVNTFGRAECRANLVLRKATTIEKPRVLEAPTIVRPLQALLVPKDSTVTLEAEYSGVPNPEIKWFKNGKELVDEDIETKDNVTKLVIKKTTKKTTGKYEIRVVNEAGEARTSGSVTITDREEIEESLLSGVRAPRFIQPLKPQLVAEAESVMMDVRVESHPTASFQWFIHSEPVVSSTETKIMTDGNRSILLLSHVTKQHIGDVTCRAENVAGSVTCTATLSLLPDTTTEEVMESPRFVKTPEHAKVMDGQSVLFTAKVTGKPTPLVAWSHDGQPLQEGKEVTIYQDSDGLCKLAISEVFPESSGLYTCTAVNPVGEAVAAATLLVEAYEYQPDSEVATSLMTGLSISEEDLLDKDMLDKIEEFSAPVFIIPLEETAPLETETPKKLKVKVDGTPQPVITWFKDGTELQSGTLYDIETLNDGTSELTLLNPTPEEAGEYTVEALNEYGVANSTVVLSYLDSKSYKQPEWVNRMEELQAKTKASQIVPKFIEEPRDACVHEAEPVVFETTFEGTPTPLISWYHNGLLIRNTDNVNVKITETTSTCTIQETNEDSVGIYTVKAVSPLGTAVTKAKLYCVDFDQEKMEEYERKDQEEEDKKKQLEEEERKEKEDFEQLISETMKVKTVKRKKIKKTLKEEKSTESQPEEKVEPLEIKAPEPVKAQPSLDIQQPVEVTEVVTRRQVPDDVPMELETTEERATVVQTPQEPLSVTETVSEDTVLDLPQDKKKKPRKPKSTKPESFSLEVAEVLEQIPVEEFGPGKEAVKEIATVNVMMNKGVTIEEVVTLYEAEQFPALQSDVAQSVMVKLVETVGHSAFISEVVTSESTVEETLSGVFKAFCRSMVVEHLTVEEVLSLISPEDFKSHAWTEEHAEEKIVSSTKLETVETTESKEISEAPTESRKEKHTKTRKITKEREIKKDQEDEEIIVEKKKVVKKLVKSKQHSTTSESEPTETATDFEAIPSESVKALPIETGKQIAESVPESISTELGETVDAPGKIEVKIVPLLSVETNITISSEKESDDIKVSPSITSQAVLNIDTNESVTISEANIQETADDFTNKFKPATYNASPGVMASEGVIVSEITTDQDVVETKISTEQSREARVILSTHEATITQEVQPSYKEGELQGSQLPTTVKAEANFIPQEGIFVTEITHSVDEQTLPDMIKPIPVSPKLEIQPSEPVQVTEVFTEMKPEKYYPELIVPTEVADERVVPGNQLAQTSELLLPEKEGSLSAQKIPQSKHADMKLSLDKSLIISEQQVHEKEKPFSSEKNVGASTVSTSFTPFEGIEVTEVHGETKEQELFIEKIDEKKGDVVVDNEESAILATFNVPIEREQSLSPESKPSTKTAEFKYDCLETSNVLETLTHESESVFESVDRPKGVFPVTTVQPLQSIEITETQTGDVPTDFVNPLKYSTDQASTSYETVESKEVSQIIPQEKESPLHVSEMPTPKTVTPDISGLKSVQITQTLPAEKEDELKVPRTPESHRGRQVPGHPLHSLIVEEVQSESTTGVVNQESFPLQSVKVRQDTHQETVIHEIICDESVGESDIKQFETSSAGIAMVPEESIQITEILSNEKEENYDQPQQPDQVFAEKSIRPQEAFEVSEVVSHYESSRFSPETVKQSVAVPGTTPLESLSITEYETSEKESNLPKDIFPEMKSATFDLCEEQIGVSISEVQTADKEENLISEEKPKSFIANRSVSGHNIAIKSEVLPDQNFEDLIITEKKKRLAEVKNIPHQEVIITEVTVSEQEKDLNSFEPESKAAVIAITPEKAVNVTEIISADFEGILMKDKKPDSQIANTVILQQDIAEQSEVISNISTGILERTSPEKVLASISHDTLQHIVSSELTIGEKESDFIQLASPTLKSANLNYEEGKAIVVTEVNTIDAELPMAEKGKTKESYATLDIEGQKVAAISEPFIAFSTGEVEQFAPSVSKAKPENVPLEAVVSFEVLPSESEGKYNADIKPDLQQAKPSFKEELGLTVSLVTCEDKEHPLEKEQIDSKSCRHSHTESHSVASASEVLLLGSISDLETVKPISAQAKIGQLHHESIVQSVISPNEKEGEFEETLKSNIEQAKVSFEEGKSTTVLEIVPGQVEEELKKEHVPEKKSATISVTGNKVAEKLEVVCEGAVEEFVTSDIPMNKANISHGLNESLITSQVEVKEKEGEYRNKDIPDEQVAKPIIDENETLKSLIVSQNTVEEKEEQLETKGKPSTKVATISLQEQKSLPTVEQLTLFDKTIPFIAESDKERHAIPDVQNQTVVAQQFEVTTNISEGVFSPDIPKPTTALIQQDTFEGILNTEILIQDSESKFTGDTKPSSKIASLNIDALEAASTLQVDVQDVEQSYIVEEPEEQRARCEVIPNLVVENLEITAEQDLSDISTPVKEKSQAKSTIIPHTSVIQTTTEVSESEKELKDKFTPAGKTANIQVTEDTCINVSEIQLAEKEDVLPIAEKEKSRQAHPSITSQEVAITTETHSSLSVSDLKEKAKPDKSTATVEQTTLTGLTQTEVHVLDKEQDFNETTKTSQSATVQFEEGQSINVTTHTLTDTVDEFHVSDKPTQVSAKVEISPRISLQQTDVRAESQVEPLDLHVPKPVQIVPTQTVLEAIGVSENVIQESESDWHDNDKTETSKAHVKLEPQEIASMSTIYLDEKEGTLPESTTPKLAQATFNVSEQKVAQKSENIAVSITKDLSDLTYKTDKAQPTAETFEHLIQSQPSVHEPSEKEFKTVQSDLKTGNLNIESKLAIASTSEVLTHEKENELTSSKTPTPEKANEDIIDHKPLISTENIPFEKATELSKFETPPKRDATKECIPFEGIEQTEVLVQETDGILNIKEKIKELKLETKFQEEMSVNVQEVIVHEKETESTILKAPIPETVKVKITEVESLESTEIVPDSSLGDLPITKTEFEIAKRGPPSEHQSIEVSMASPHESEGVYVEDKTPTSKAPIVIEPLDSIQVTEITPEEHLGTLQEKQPKSQFIASQHVSELIPSLIQMETTTEMTEGEHLIERPKYTGTTEITETHTMGTTNEIKRRTVLRKGNSSQDSESHEDIIIEEIIKLDDKPKEEVTSTEIQTQTLKRRLKLLQMLKRNLKLLQTLKRRLNWLQALKRRLKLLQTLKRKLKMIQTLK